MRLWIDNTGLHSAGCALSRGARAELDVRGLLQLATLLVFGDEVLVSGFEAESIAQRSSEFLHRLYALGVPASVIRVSPETEASYRRACQDTAERLGSRLISTFQPNEAGILGLEPSDLPPRLEAAQTAFVELSIQEISAAELAQTREQALEAKASGAISYMMAISPKLRNSVRNLSASPDWRPLDSYQLNAYLRFHLNTSLAAHRSAVYTPAIARARLQRRRNASIIGRLMDQVDEVVQKLGEIPLEAPSVAQALVAKSNGHPEGVIEQALIYRERASGLRRYLERRLRTIDPETGEGQFEIDKVAKELAQDLARELGLEVATKLPEAVEVLFVLGLPVPEVSGQKLVQWTREQWRGRRISVLTELSREYLGTLDPREEYDVLVHNCHRKGG